MSGEARTLEQVIATAPAFLTTRQAAELLQVSVETLRAMPVPYLTVGAGRKRPRRRYLRETVVQWAKEQEVA